MHFTIDLGAISQDESFDDCDNEKFEICHNGNCFDQGEHICEYCNKTFCSNHISTYWTQNFVQHAFLAQKKQFNSSKLCKRCETKSRIIGVFLAVFLLIPFLITPFALLFG
ncbi:MAG: hypothetical protein ACFFD1_11430 [Candidatus Thorarchaeota archaeon]